jgi:hypothetical protein
MASCKSNGHNVSDHFTEVSNPIVSGKGGTQYVPDYRLTRFACYLVAMNGDMEAEAFKSEKFSDLGDGLGNRAIPRPIGPSRSHS